MPSRTVQSHSDVLDLLAFGGLVGLLLFAIPILRIVMAAPRGILASAQERNAAGAYLWAVLLVLVMAITFNPIWHQPHLMLFFWLAVGYGCSKVTAGGGSAPVAKHSHATTHPQVRP
jgi:O-antigen ligase